MINLEKAKVDICWEDRKLGILKARLYLGKKKNSGVKFKIDIDPVSGIADCKKCPFKTNTYICGKLIQNRGHVSLCSMLWKLPGDNKFPGRTKVHVFSPIPL